MGKKRPTKRALDWWESAAFSSIFLASSFSCSQALSTPAHTQVTQTVRNGLITSGCDDTDVYGVGGKKGDGATAKLYQGTFPTRITYKNTGSIYLTDHALHKSQVNLSLQAKNIQIGFGGLTNKLI